MNKSTAPRQSSQTVRLPKGAIVQPATYWYFVVDLILALRRDFSIDDNAFAEYLKGTGLDEESANLQVQFFASETDIEQLAGKVFSHLPYNQEQKTYELALDAILIDNGYSHSTPDTRAKMGKKMFEGVTTKLVDDDLKTTYVKMIGNNMIQHLIDSE